MFLSMLSSTDIQVIQFIFDYCNEFAIKTGSMYDQLREIEQDMTESEKIILNRKLSIVYNTLEQISHEKAREKAKRDNR